MGEISEMMINGFLCQECGEVIDGDEPGFRRHCDSCLAPKDEIHRWELTQYLIKQAEEERQFYNCFISYSNDNAAFAQKLYQDLTKSGVQTFYAPEHLTIGGKIRTSLDVAISASEKLILIVSKASIESQWVEQEIEKILEIERTNKQEEMIVPIRIDDYIFQVTKGWANFLKNTRNVGDFTKWDDSTLYASSFSRLLSAITKPQSEINLDKLDII